MSEGIEFITIDLDFEKYKEISYPENTYQKCKKIVNYICRYNRLSENCLKLYKSCEKFKEFKD